MNEKRWADIDDDWRRKEERSVAQRTAKTLELLEDQEDRDLLRTWLEQRTAGQVDMMPLEELERDLEADGFL